MDGTEGMEGGLDQGAPGNMMSWIRVPRGTIGLINLGLNRELMMSSSRPCLYPHPRPSVTLSSSPTLRDSILIPDPP